MKYLVIGGAGYIGSHFVYKGIEEGHNCLVLDNLSLGHKEAIHPKASFVEADLLDRQRLRTVIMDFQPDAVFHFAAFALVGESVADPQKYYHNNVEGVRGLLDVIKDVDSNIPLIFSSTCAVFGAPQRLPMKEDDPKNPISPYGRSKLMAEFLLEDYGKAYGMKSIALRYFNACGAHSSGLIGEDHRPETHLIPNIIKSVFKGESLKIFGSDFETKDGTCVRDYIHVEDLARAHMLAANKLIGRRESFYDVYQLGSGQGYSNLEILRAVEDVLEREIPYVFSERRPGDPAALYTAVDKARTELGFETTHSDLDTIIRSAINWHEKSPTGFGL